jgi:hypothetical protein
MIGKEIELFEVQSALIWAALTTGGQRLSSTANASPIT